MFAVEGRDGLWVVDIFEGYPLVVMVGVTKPVDEIFVSVSPDAVVTDFLDFVCIVVAGGKNWWWALMCSGWELGVVVCMVWFED